MNLNLKQLLITAAAALVPLTAAAGHEGPCMALPTSSTTTSHKVTDPQCSASCVGVIPPVDNGWEFRGAGFRDGVLKYSDGSQRQCEQKRGPREEATGFCRADTVCPLGASRVQEGGTFKCRASTTVTVPGPSNPRQACIDGLPRPPAVSITEVTPGLRAPQYRQAVQVRGDNVALPGNRYRIEGANVQLEADSANAGAPGCAPPHCVRLQATTSADAAGMHTLVITAGHGHGEARKSVHIAQTAVASPQLDVPVAGDRRSCANSSCTGGGPGHGGAVKPAVTP